MPANLVTNTDIDAIFGPDFFRGMPSPTAAAIRSGRAAVVADDGDLDIAA